MVRRLAITAGILTLLVAMLPPSRNAAAAHSSGGDPHRCSNIQLVIRLYKNPGAAAGQGSLIYRIHDLWGGSCVLRGYPGLELLDHNFHSLPTHVSRRRSTMVGTIPIRRIILNARSDAYFALSYHDIPLGNQSCRRAQYLMIFPPNDNLPVVTYSRVDDSPSYFAPCGGDVSVSPVAARTSFR